MFVADVLALSGFFAHPTAQPPAQGEVVLGPVVTCARPDGAGIAAGTDVWLIEHSWTPDLATAADQVGARKRRCAEGTEF